MKPPTHDWDGLAASSAFQRLLHAKRQFIVPACVFFIVYYFALPVLVGYAPELMRKKIFGPVHLAYLFALSQFVMAWILAWLYTRAASRFDRMAKYLIRDWLAASRNPSASSPS
jgi:uncharacterized membrane protein (DUF485 family)